MNRRSEIIYPAILMAMNWQGVGFVELGRRTGISAATIRRKLIGAGKITLAEAEAIRRALGREDATLDALFYVEEENPSAAGGGTSPNMGGIGGGSPDEEG